MTCLTLIEVTTGTFSSSPECPAAIYHLGAKSLDDELDVCREGWPILS